MEEKLKISKLYRDTLPQDVYFGQTKLSSILDQNI